MTPFIGQLALFSFPFPPKGWAFCQGQLLPINQNQALFSLLGTTFGGNGQTNFALPDLRGRTPVSVGPATVLGERAGEEQHTLLISEVAKHNHIINATSAGANTPSPAGNLLAQTGTGQTVYLQNPQGVDSSLVGASVSPYGGSQPHENRSPYLVLNWCIALTGIFPSRN